MTILTTAGGPTIRGLRAFTQIVAIIPARAFPADFRIREEELARREIYFRDYVAMTRAPENLTIPVQVKQAPAARSWRNDRPEWCSVLSRPDGATQQLFEWVGVSEQSTLGD